MSYFILRAFIFSIFFSSFTFAESSIDKELLKIINDKTRIEKNSNRDKFRNPLETLKFFGLNRTNSVLEITPGAGWYTEILAPYAKKNGKFYAAVIDPKSIDRPFFGKLLARYENFLKKFPDKFSKVKIIKYDYHNPEFSPKIKVDYVLTFRNVHNWAKNGTSDQMFQSFYRSLKKGGILGVVEHRAKENTSLDNQIKTGYMTEKYVIDLAVKTGFKFVDKSEINANSLDDRNHPNGVWTLLPNLRGLENDEKDYYRKIGESDRMTLKFLKE